MTDLEWVLLECFGSPRSERCRSWQADDIICGDCEAKGQCWDCLLYEKTSDVRAAMSKLDKAAFSCNCSVIARRKIARYEGGLQVRYKSKQ